jgi:alcohol dehydrogenase
LGVAVDPRDYGYSLASWTALLESAGQGERGRNYSGSIDTLIDLYRDIYFQAGEQYD